MNIDLTKFDRIVVSISGGKDSQVVLLETVELAEKQKIPKERILALSSDTGADWLESIEHCRYLTGRFEIPFLPVYPSWSIPDYIDHRGKFPSSACRYCTSLKTGSLDKAIRHLAPARGTECRILSITGERREESDHRAKLEEFEEHPRLTVGNRQVCCYRPILDYRVGKVWDTIKKSRLEAHPAYEVYGNERLSCALCVLACENDIRNGAKARPDLAERYLAVEKRTGHTFRHNRSLAEILASPMKPKPIMSDAIQLDLFENYTPTG